MTDILGNFLSPRYVIFGTIQVLGIFLMRTGVDAKRKVELQE